MSATPASTNKLMLLLGGVLVVAILHLARDIFLPIAMSVLLSFLLSPVASRFERLGIGRMPSVLVTVALCFAILGAIGWVVTNQFVDLAGNLPKYRRTILSQVESIKTSFSGAPSPTVEALQDLAADVSKAAGAGDYDAQTTGPSKESEPAEPLPVKLVETSPLPWRLLRQWAGPVFAPLGNIAVVIIFVIFILLSRDDLRDRLIRLAGTGRVYLTTQALDEAAARMSRFLVMQLVINSLYGMAVAIGLLSLSIPNWFLWGLLAMVMRFVPYVGPWIGAVLPISLAFAVSEGWLVPLLTVGLFVLLELVTNNVLEPWLYGSSTGISVIGIVLSAVFWAWLWGPIGLVLATPLTACLIVAGRHIPQLGFLNVLLSDEPPLEQSVRFYQRLLTFDDHEASDIAGKFLQSASLDEAYEKLLIPALSFAEHDRHAGHLNENQARFVQRTIRDLVDELGERYDMASAVQAAPEMAVEQTTTDALSPTMKPAKTLLCIPAEDEADHLAGTMVSQLLKARGHEVRTLARPANVDEARSMLTETGASGIIVSALAPGGAISAREVAKQFRNASKSLMIVVGIWNARGDLAATEKRLASGGTNLTTTSLKHCLEYYDKQA